jgi:hypothetical protein
MNVVQRINGCIFSAIDWVLAFDTDHFVLGPHMLPITTFLHKLTIERVGLARSRELAYVSHPESLASAPAILFRRYGERSDELAFSDMLVFGPASRRPFGILPPSCVCGVDSINMRVSGACGKTPRFQCLNCKRSTSRFVQPEWSKNVEGSALLYKLPYPSPSFEDVPKLMTGESRVPRPKKGGQIGSVSIG